MQTEEQSARRMAQYRLKISRLPGLGWLVFFVQTSECGSGLGSKIGDVDPRLVTAFPN